MKKVELRNQYKNIMDELREEKDFNTLSADQRWKFEVALAKKMARLDDAGKDLELENLTGEKILEEIPKLRTQHRRERFTRLIRALNVDEKEEKQEMTEEQFLELKEDVREVIFGRRRDDKPLKGLRKVPKIE